MAIYRCDSCEGFFDEDWVGCNAHPSDPCALLCDGCAEEFACVHCGDYYDTQFNREKEVYECKKACL